LSGLYLSEIFAVRNGQAIKELDLSDNIKMESKSAQFIGEALLANPNYPIEYIKFKGVNLEQTGLYRLLEAVNANKNIHKLHIGVISDYGLRTMAEILKTNKSLSKIEFQEDPAKRWTEGAKQAFTLMLKSHTELQTVRFKSAKNGEGES
jgi:hypothetical protein